MTTMPAYEKTCCRLLFSCGSELSAMCCLVSLGPSGLQDFTCQSPPPTIAAWILNRCHAWCGFQPNRRKDCAPAVAGQRRHARADSLQDQSETLDGLTTCAAESQTLLHKSVHCVQEDRGEQSSCCKGSGSFCFSLSFGSAA
jgi:hypothetical protein